MLFQHLGDCAASNPMIQVLQRTLDPCVAPAGVLLGHPDNELADPSHHARTTDSLVGICPLRCDQLAVPGQDRIGRYNRGDLVQDLSAERFPLSCQSSTLVVSETQAPPARLELLLKNTVLFDQVTDHGRLLAADPARERRQQELELDVFKHPGSVSDGLQVVALQRD